MDGLASAARSRSEADWLVGINGTRAMTAFNSRDGGFFLTTVGRVQTPTLSLVVEREEKIRTSDELAWLYRACHNRAIDYIRRGKKLTHFTEEKFDRIEAPEENAKSRAWHELRGTLRELAIRFDKKGEGILLLHMLEEGKPKLLIAETLQISDRHLRRRVSQLFQFFQQELRKMGIEKVELE